MEKDHKISFITLWRFNDWGLYNRRDEALLWELSRREEVESVLHVEHIGFKGLVYKILQWIKEKDVILRNVYWEHIRKGISWKPVLVNNEKKYYIYSVVILNFGRNPLLQKLSDFLKDMQYRAINKFFGGIKKNVALVVYPPVYPFEAIKAIRHDLLIMDFEDDSAERVKDENLKRQMRDNYRKILPECKWIFTHSPWIIEKYKEYAKSKIDLIASGVDIHNFEENSHKKFLDKNGKKVAGYVGVLNREIDIELLEYLIVQCPDVNFILIGYATEELLVRIRSMLERYHNLSYLGERSFKDIPGYLSDFDVLLNIKKNDHTTAGGESQKIYEYLASGKPIVTTPVPPADRFADLMYVSSDKIQFAEFLKTALEEDNEELRGKRIMIALENSWAKRVDVILDKVSQLL